MKQVSTLALLLLLTACGCQHPTEVDVTQDGEQVDVTPLAAADTSAYENAIDSTAVTPEDEARFPGFMLVTRATFDHGSILVSKTLSKVVFTDTSRPYLFRNRPVGYFGLMIMRPASLLSLTINGSAMLPVPHLVRGEAFGTEYVGEANMVPGSVLTWRAGADIIGAIDVSVQIPPAISVSSPAGGSVVPRNQDLVLRWNGAGAMTIYVSARDSITGKSRPVLKLTPLANIGHARIPVKVLRALPHDRSFVFTFVLANRKEGALVTRFKGNVLAQAASVYNSYVELR